VYRVHTQIFQTQREHVLEKLVGQVIEVRHVFQLVAGRVSGNLLRTTIFSGPSCFDIAHNLSSV
jgi:hypothetical protein